MPESKDPATQEIIDVIERAEREIDDDPLFYTLFNPCQIRCIEAFGRNPKMIIVAMPNGVGKTFVLVAIMGAVMFGTKNPLFAAPVFKDWPYKRSLRFASTAKSVEDGGAFQTAIRELWPKGRYIQSRGSGRGYFSYIETDKGFEVDVLTYNQAPLEHASGTRGGNFLSEPPPKPVFTENFTRLRGQGPMYLEMTPITYAAYIKDEYIDPGCLMLDGEEVGRIEVVTGDIEEACKDHHEGGQLTHVDIQQQIAGWPIEERELRRTGKFGSQAGLIYQCWGDHNELEELPEYHADMWERGKYNLWHVVDPHDRKPFAVGWLATFPNNDVVAVAEYPDYMFHEVSTGTEDVEDYRRLILAAEKDLGTPYRRLMDPNFANAPKLGQDSIKKLMAKPCRECREKWEKGNRKGSLDCPHRLLYHEPPDSIPEGHLLVRKAIGNLKEGVRPKLYALKDCKNFCYTMRHYGYKGDVKRDENGPREDPQLVHKDFPDLIRYGFLAGMGTYREETVAPAPGKHLVRRGKSIHAT